MIKNIYIIIIASFFTVSLHSKTFSFSGLWNDNDKSYRVKYIKVNGIDRVFISSIYVYPEHKESKGWFVRFNPSDKSFHLEGLSVKHGSSKPMLFFFESIDSNPTIIEIPHRVVAKMCDEQNIVDLCEQLIDKARKPAKARDQGESTHRPTKAR
mgnify:CR=1 FL=1